MPDESTISFKVAECLLQIKAIKLNVQNPFTWASGWRSPIYCDNRKLLSYPEVRDFVINSFVDKIKVDFPNVNAIAGVATAGIALAALIADRMKLPMIYVRSKPKAHGLGQSIEGAILPDMNVVVIEDLISTGSSSLQAIKELREADINVLGLGAIFSYAFDKARDSFENSECTFFTLSDYHALTELALKEELIKEADIDQIKAWREDPAMWNQ